MENKHSQYMKMAIELAKQGQGYTNPNPLVGAVIVKNDKLIGKGYHAQYGCPHAERNAFANCTESPEGADLYVTLTPCCHYGKTPPCSQAILENGIKQVFIGSTDPNPKVRGKSINFLKNHGVKVHTGVEKELCDELNPVFFHYITKHLPFVVMKYAMTMDGKIATNSGLSKWITGEKAREQVHRDRHRLAGIMVGVKTVLKDNPMLTARLALAQQPLRIVVDTHLRTPLNCALVNSLDQAPLLIATCSQNQEKIKSFENRGVEILTLPIKYGHADLKILMEKLGERKIDSLLLEGGGTLNWSMLSQGLVQEVQTYIAPKIFGGQGNSPVGGGGIDSPHNAFRLKRKRVEYFGEDILIVSQVLPKEKKR